MRENLFYTLDDLAKERDYLPRAIREGLVDEIMIPHLERINKLPYIVTSACCGGHRDHRSECYINRGYLVLSLTKKGFNRLFLDGCKRDSFNKCFSTSFVFNRGISCALDFRLGCSMFICFDTESHTETDQIINKIYKLLKDKLQ